jgi:hypothetical protein
MARGLGYPNFVMGNGASVGFVWQYTGPTDEAQGKTVPVDLGVYGQVSAPVAATPSAGIGATIDLGAQYGTIHNGFFEGKAINYSGLALGGGVEASFSMDEKGDLTFSGLAVRAGPSFGFSVNQSQTAAITGTDLWNRFFGR